MLAEVAQRIREAQRLADEEAGVGPAASSGAAASPGGRQAGSWLKEMRKQCGLRQPNGLRPGSRDLESSQDLGQSSGTNSRVATTRRRSVSLSPTRLAEADAFVVQAHVAESADDTRLVLDARDGRGAFGRKSSALRLPRETPDFGAAAAAGGAAGDALAHSSPIFRAAALADALSASGAAAGAGAGAAAAAPLGAQGPRDTPVFGQTEAPPQRARLPGLSEEPPISKLLPSPAELMGECGNGQVQVVDAAGKVLVRRIGSNGPRSTAGRRVLPEFAKPAGHMLEGGLVRQSVGETMFDPPAREPYDRLSSSAPESSSAESSWFR